MQQSNPSKWKPVVSGLPIEEGDDLAELLSECIERMIDEAKTYPFEVEKPLELENLVTEINPFLNEFLGEYGVAARAIRSSSVHLVDLQRLLEMVPGEKRAAAKKYCTEHPAQYIPKSQEIFILAEYDKDKLTFYHTLIHEVLHMNSFLSYGALQAEDKREKVVTVHEKENGERKVELGINRQGLNMVAPDGNVYLRDLDDAVIQQLVMDFDRKFSSRIEVIADAIQVRQNFIKGAMARNLDSKAGMSVQSVVETEDQAAPPDKRFRVTVGLWDRFFKEEREKLNLLIDDLYEKNKAEFKSRDDVFTLFVSAVFKGELLPLVKLIEKTHGKGAFRVLAYATRKKRP